MDGDGNNGTLYYAQLIAFADEAARNDCRGTPSGSFLLKLVQGNANDDGTWKTVSFEFTTNPDTFANSDALELDLGIRFKGATTSATIDNVPMTPEPVTTALLALGGFAVLARRRRIMA